MFSTAVCNSSGKAATQTHPEVFAIWRGKSGGREEETQKGSGLNNNFENAPPVLPKRNTKQHDFTRGRDQNTCRRVNPSSCYVPLIKITALIWILGWVFLHILFFPRVCLTLALLSFWSQGKIFLFSRVFWARGRYLLFLFSTHGLL